MLSSLLFDHILYDIVLWLFWFQSQAVSFNRSYIYANIGCTCILFDQIMIVVWRQKYIFLSKTLWLYPLAIVPWTAKYVKYFWLFSACKSGPGREYTCCLNNPNIYPMTSQSLQNSLTEVIINNNALLETIFELNPMVWLTLHPNHNYNFIQGWSIIVVSSNS